MEINLWLFFPIVGCELNVNARVCKHDVTCFISFVPGCFILSVEALHNYAVHSKNMYSGPTIQLMCIA